MTLFSGFSEASFQAALTNNQKHVCWFVGLLVYLYVTLSLYAKDAGKETYWRRVEKQGNIKFTLDCLSVDLSLLLTAGSL